MKYFFDKMYSLYSASPKNQNELITIGNELSISLKKIGRILGTRWVASSARSVKAIWSNYPALVQHFENAAVNSNRTTKERSKYSGLKLYITNKSFVLNTGMLLDALIELESLSLELQKRSTNIQKAHKLLEMKYRVFDSMRATAGEYTEVASKACEDEMFKGVSLHKGRVAQIDQNKFFECLCENLKKRMYTTSVSRLSTAVSHELNEKRIF